MPTVMQSGSYRFFWYSGECHEPPHIHVRKGSQTAKFWLDQVQVAKPGRFKAPELAEIERLIIEYQDYFLEEWEKQCGGQK